MIWGLLSFFLISWTLFDWILFTEVVCLNGTIKIILTLLPVILWNFARVLNVLLLVLKAKFKFAHIYPVLSVLICVYFGRGVLLQSLFLLKYRSTPRHSDFILCLWCYCTLFFFLNYSNLNNIINIGFKFIIFLINVHII